jgi:hypothetical protein
MISMPANLGIVAYAMVRADGSSPELNSGITTVRVQPGVYKTVLPGNSTSQESLQEEQSSFPRRDMIVITPCEGLPLSYTVQAPSNSERLIFFVDSSMQPQDTDFSILVFRSVISPPVDASGNYTAPA